MIFKLPWLIVLSYKLQNDYPTSEGHDFAFKLSVIHLWFGTGLSSVVCGKDDKNKIFKHAEIDRHLEFAAADFYMWNLQTEISLRI